MFKNKFILITGPSGVGKATLEKKLFEKKDLRLRFSISATTRKPRKGEENGKDYFFMSRDLFLKKIENNDFLEWNEHFSNMYGTLKTNINEIQKENFIPVLEVEIEGAKKIIKKYNKSLISFFISPPSIDVLAKRIRKRGTESEEQITQRVSRASEEMKHVELFDHVIVNDSVNDAVAKIEKILEKELLN